MSYFRDNRKTKINKSKLLTNTRGNVRERERERKRERERETIVMLSVIFHMSQSKVDQYKILRSF